MRMQRQKMFFLLITPVLLMAVFYAWQSDIISPGYAQGISQDQTPITELTPSSTTLPAIDLGDPIPGPATITPTLTSTPTSTPTATATATNTSTATPTATNTATHTPTGTINPSQEPTETPNPYSYLPLVIREPTPIPDIPPQKVLFCDTLTAPLYIPDNDPIGASNETTVYDPRLIVDLDVALNIKHTWVGDLIANLTHVDTGKSVNLIDRPGIPASNQGCYENDLIAILDDEISSPAENKCAPDPAAVSGIFLPNNPLSSFDGKSVTGTWRLDVSDNYRNDTGHLSSWCLVASISPYGQPPTPVPPPPPAPMEAQISGISGRKQALPLDCESRSAVDWAGYFGYSIGELAFFNQLPHSDNPDKGFVGNVYGTWGQIPPNSYGVHAEPVAALLRAYGVPAYAHRPLSWEHLKAEIAAGRPVFVWIVGSVQNGIPVYFTPPDGLSTIVARYEHTVVVTGYSASRVYFLNGATIYSKPIDEFLDSWSVLGNMAITALP